MHDPAAVSRLNSIGYLSRDLGSLSDRHDTGSVHVFAQCLSINQLHDDVRSAIGQHAIVVCISDVRMIEPRSRACFSAKTLKGIGVGSEVG